MELFNGDCLEKMKDLETDSVDLLFCDLPYGQTSCKWDCLIDLDLFWKEVNRVCKINAPMFFTCSTKFGVSLINSNPKNFRYDLVWVKSAPTGFLNAKKMPMKKHEMVYVFYRKLPFYNIADNHTHKFMKKPKNEVVELCKYDVNKNCYGGGKEGRIKISKDKKDHQQKYDPPLPTSVVNEPENEVVEPIYGKNKKKTNEDVYNANERVNNGKLYHYERKHQKGSDPIYDPPLPNSILEVPSQKGKHPTQKPTALMEWVLKYYTRENDLVLDPTMGSGSTGVACQNMNRRFIGIEMDEKIFEDAKKRLIKN
jgi:DNA modification methylase